MKSAERETVGRSTIGGGLIGGLVGLLTGPVGALVGGSMGALVGMTEDVLESDEMDRYLDRFAQRIPIGKTTLVSHLWEDSRLSVNTALQPFGAQVTRLDTDLELLGADRRAEAELDKEISQDETYLKHSVNAARADWKTNVDELKAKRDQTGERLKTPISHQKQRYETWLSSERKKLTDWQAGIAANRDQKKNERIEHRIADQEKQLAEVNQHLRAV